MQGYQIIKHEKSYETRYEEYKTIFTAYNEDKNLNQADLKAIWGCYLEISLEPVGWLAAWKISKEFCLELSISYPCTAVVVMVDRVDFDNVTADVTVTDVGDTKDNFPPSVLNVPLKDLYPVVQQVNMLNSSHTAMCLDQFRFFTDHLWCPWDGEYSANENLLETYLDFRLKLCYDLIDETVKEHILGLMANGVKLQWLIEEHCKITNNMSVDDADMTIEQNSDDLSLIIGQEKIVDDYVGQCLQIRNQLDRWKNILSNTSGDAVSTEMRNGVSIIVPPCSIVDMKKLFQDISKILPSTQQYITKVTNDLQQALFNCVRNDIVIVCPRTHLLYSVGNITRGGKIRGLSCEDRPVIKIVNMRLNSFDFYKGEVLIQDIVFNFTKCVNGIMVHCEGKLTLQNTDLHCEYKDDSQAIVVSEGASFTASNCKFVGFDVAIVCLPRSRINLTDCVFENVRFYLKVFEDAVIKEIGCSIVGTSEKPIQHHSNKWSNAFY